MKHLVLPGLLLAALGGAAPLHAQACNGLPLRHRGVVAGTYLNGTAAETPLQLEQYGAAVVYQLPGRSPWGTHQAVRLDGRYGDAAAERKLNGLLVDRFPGHQYGASAGYTVDVLPSSYVGQYVVCLNVGADASHWDIDGESGTVFSLPAGLSFGIDLHRGAVGILPHASFGGFWFKATGDTPLGHVQRDGFKPWSEGGLGVTLGPAHVDATIRHEFKTRERGRITVGWFF